MKLGEIRKRPVAIRRRAVRFVANRALLTPVCNLLSIILLDEQYLVIIMVPIIVKQML